MAIVCDLCGKSAAERGPGKYMYRLEAAYGCNPDISIMLTPEGSMDARYSRYSNVVCGRCLHKMGVDKALADHREREEKYERHRKALKVAPHLIPFPTEGINHVK